MEKKRCNRSYGGRYRSKFLPLVNWLLLPHNVLLKIFLHLSPVDKANVRVTCSHFKTLTDHPDLWKKSTLVLRNLGVFNDKFLGMLKARKVRSVEVDQIKLYHWKRLITTLPDLKNVTVHSRMTSEALQALRPLADLQRLQLTNCTVLKDQDLLMVVCHFEQLTHLWLHDLTINNLSVLVGHARFQNLCSLHLHGKDVFFTLSFRDLVFRLPKLRELSLSGDNMSNPSMSFCFSAPETLEGKAEASNCVPSLQLHKLEFINPGFTKLTVDAFRQLSTVKTFSLQHYKHTANEVNLLTSMLKGLPNMTELKLAWSRLVQEGSRLSFAHYLPKKLEKLILFEIHLSDSDLAALFSTTRELKHLDLSFCHGFDQHQLQMIPTYFTLLTKLYLSNLSLTDNTLKALTNLRKLEELDISNNRLLTPEAILYFQSRSLHEVHLIVERPVPIAACLTLFSFYE